MCGIVGLFAKSPEIEARLGEHLGAMLVQMSDRGPDSAGVAVYRDAAAPGWSKLTLFSSDALQDWDSIAAELDGPGHVDDLRQRYADFYAGHPFVEVVEAPPGMRAVQHTNYAQVCPVVDPRFGRITVFSVIDNLGKGAAGQALQNLNLMAGLPEDEGLR